MDPIDLLALSMIFGFGVRTGFLANAAFLDLVGWACDKVRGAAEEASTPTSSEEYAAVRRLIP